MTRPSRPSDDGDVARFLAVAYEGTIDDDPDADFASELQTWRTHDGADDAASRLADEDGQLVAVCLIGSELGNPFLYEIAVHPAERGRGLAMALLTSSLDHLAAAGHDACSAWVTAGNVASERLLSAAGFEPVTRPTDGEHAVLMYRAGRCVVGLGLGTAVLAGVTVDDGCAVAWLIGDRTPTPTDVEVDGTTVVLRWLETDDPRLPELLSTMVPVHGVAALLAARRATSGWRTA